MKTIKQLIFAFILFFAVTSVMAQSENSKNLQKVSPVKAQTENSANAQSVSSSSSENRQPIRIASASVGKSPRVINSSKNSQKNAPQQSGMKMTRLNEKNTTSSSQQNADSSLEIGKK